MRAQAGHIVSEAPKVFNPVSRLYEGVRLPYTKITLEDVKRTLEPHYDTVAEYISTGTMRRELEETLYQHLKWYLEADLDAYRYREKGSCGFFGIPEAAGGVQFITRERANKSYARMNFAPFSRLGFAKIPLRVEQASILKKHREQNTEFPPRWQKVDKRLGGDSTILVCFSFCLKGTMLDRGQAIPEYRDVSLWCCYDQEKGRFWKYKVTFNHTEMPGTDGAVLDNQ